MIDLKKIATAFYSSGKAKIKIKVYVVKWG